MLHEVIVNSVYRFPLKNLALAGVLCVSAPWAETQGAPPPAGKLYQESHSESCDSRPGKNPTAVVKDMYDKLGKGDLPGLLADFAKDAKWVLHGPAGIPFAGSHEGIAEVQAFFESFGQNATPSKFETREFIADKDRVVVLGYEEVTATPTGKVWKAHWTMVFTVQKGKIVSVDEVVDTAAILAAFQP